MNREDIIRMAIEAGLNLYVNDLTEKQYLEVIKHFAALVASAEREKYEAIITNMTKLLEAQQNREGVAVDMIAAAVAAEREACSALCFDIWNRWLDSPEEDRHKMLYDAEDCAAAIRARGQA